jgi:hypothetical protein
MSAPVRVSIHLFSPSIYLSLDLTIVLSTNIQNWHDYNAFQLPKSTAQCEQSGMSHQYENVSEDFSCSMVGWGARAACAEVSTGSVEASKGNLGFVLHLVYTEEYNG